MGGSTDPLATFALGTTRGMREVESIKAAPSAWVAKPAARGTIGFAVRAAFLGFAALHLLGVIVSLWVAA